MCFYSDSPATDLATGEIFVQNRTWLHTLHRMWSGRRAKPCRLCRRQSDKREPDWSRTNMSLKRPIAASSDLVGQSNTTLSPDSKKSSVMAIGGHVYLSFWQGVTHFRGRWATRKCKNDGISRGLFINRGGDVYHLSSQGVMRFHHRVVMIDRARMTGFSGNWRDHHQEGERGLVNCCILMSDQTSAITTE